jgi:hypothetical protein
MHARHATTDTNAISNSAPTLFLLSFELSLPTAFRLVSADLEQDRLPDVGRDTQTAVPSCLLEALIIRVRQFYACVPYF